jgi:hypothetical protein
VVYYKVTFSFNAIFSDSDSFDVAYGKVCNSIGYFRNTICENLPATILDLDPSCRTNFHFISFSKGSITVDLKFDASNYTSPADAASEISAARLLPPGAVIITSSVSAPGQTSMSTFSSGDSGTNLALILGVSIPLGLLRTSSPI